MTNLETNIQSQLEWAPIVLFAYNRPDHLERTLGSLKKNIGASESRLFIYCDGPKPGEESSTQAVRDLAHRTEGFKEVTVFESSENRGLANSIISGVTEQVNRFGKVVVLEDDMVTSPHFLSFLNDGLKEYEHDDKVISIHGYAYPTKKSLPENFFLRGSDCWGWATWKRGWDLFEADGQKLLDEILEKDLTYEFNLLGSYDYLTMLKNQIVGKNNSWAIRWHASAFLRDRLTLYSGQSLVENIGLDGSGTHCGVADNFNSDHLPQQKIPVTGIEPVENREALKAFADYFHSTRPSLFTRIRRRLLG